ncbi:iron complex transport system substrate-binding protein [Dietzia sp. 2505]|uniref:ABC transporter substrate-binding protein n=1 Tax=Dietzia sp. 2505 TaxID=3156457 RepID=UPI0033946252
MIRKTRPARAMVAGTLALTLAALAACSPGGEATGDGAEGTSPGATRTVPTPKGDVTVPADPQRVVVLNYALAGYLYELDVPIAATIPEDADQTNAEFSELWGQAPAEDGTEFLPWSADGFDLEAILETDPDLIVAGGWGFPNFQADEAYEDLTAIAPTVIVDKAFADWQDQAEFLAVDVFGKPEAFEDMVGTYESRVAEVAEAIEVPPQPTSFISVTADGTPYLLFENTGLPLMFGELGFEADDLVARNALQPYQPGGDMAELSTEQLGRIVDSKTVFVMGFNGETTSVEQLADEPAWRNLPAFVSANAFDLPYWALRHDYDEALALLDLVEEEFGR